MKYYCEMENRIITSEEMVRKYGTSKPIKALCIHELSEQPSYEPVAFERLANGKFYPVQSYDAMKARAVAALVDQGLTTEQALATLEA